MSGTVLVLDDSLTVRMDLTAALEGAGHEVIACATGEAAREVLATRPVDVVILDVLLPDVDGVEFIHEVRASAHGRDAVVLMLSSEADVRQRIRGLRTGADDYIGKPYDLGYVLARVQASVGTRATDEEPPLVLVVDDSSTTRAQVSEACVAAGYRVLTANDGQGGLRLAGVSRPAAMIVDGELPDIDGPTVIRRMRLDEAMRGIPCVLLTGTDDSGAEVRALESGADAFVRKDEDLEVLIARVAAVMRRSDTSALDSSAVSSLHRILVVDDSETSLQSTAAALRDEGYEVVFASSGEEALEFLAVETVDCILLDLQMPGIGGQETCRRVKSSPVLRHIPLVILTAVDGRDALIDALATGADDYVSKTADVDVLTARVRAQLRRKQFEDEKRRLHADFHRIELEAAESRAARELAESRAAAESELRSQRAFLDSIVRNIPHVIVVQDAVSSRFEAINPAGEELLGYSADELVGRTPGEALPGELADVFAGLVRAVNAPDAPAELEAHPVPTRRHGTRLLSTKVLVLAGDRGEPAHVLAIAQDVTEREQAEEALRQAKAEADRANRAKSQFLSRMSHELRTPLNSVLGYGQLLELGELDESQRECVSYILRGGNHLLGLINDVLDVSRVEAGEMSLSLEPVLLADVVAEALDFVRPLAAAQSITVDHDDAIPATSGDPSPPGAAPATHPEGVGADPTLHVMGDRQRLRQVLLNLLSNAIKYNREGGAVRVGYGPSGGRVRLTVTDTGIGIPPGKLDLLFSPFERLGAEQSAIEGTGLGLALTRRLVEVMGGSIDVSSTPGAGTTFGIELARAVAPEQLAGAGDPSAPTDTAGSAQRSLTVLYVEDNLANVRLVERIAARRPGVELVVATDGTTGIAMALDRPPHLVLLDLDLPDIGGAQVLARLRSEPATRHLRVVVVSADASPDQVDAMLAQGADGYLTKPFDVGELLALLDHPAD